MSLPSRKRKLGCPLDAADVPTCIIHSDDCTSENITLLSELDNPEERFNKIQDICKQRLAEPANSVHRRSNICEQVPDKYSPEINYGYHRECYQKFTSNLSRLKGKVNTDNPEPSTHRTTRRSSSESERLIFKADCIFCHKQGRRKVKVGRSWTTEPLSKFEYGGGDSVLHAAEQKNDFDLLTRIKGYDLFACEAQYHRSCRKAYVNISVHWRSDSIEAKTKQNALEMAHQAAYNKVCATVEKMLVAKQGVVKMTDLVQEYVAHLQESAFPNLRYRSENLRAKLMKSYPQSLSFAKLAKTGKFRSDLVYSSAISTGAAVSLTYELSATDRTRDVALQIRNEIKNAFETSATLPWPPTARDFDVSRSVLPEDLDKLLRVLLTGENNTNVSNRNNRLIQSIGQDMCRAVTNGQWKLPKHILLCVTLRHMFRSAELVTLINRFGHSENYSFAVELETALATAMQQSSNLLTTQIVRTPPGQSTFHSDFDNFDQLTATGSVHTAHGIMLQDFIDVRPEDMQDVHRVSLPELEKTGDRSLKLNTELERLPDCYITQRSSPGYKITKWTCPTGEAVTKEANQRNMLWTFIRGISAETSQEVPGWSGYMSVTGQKPVSTTTVDYYPVINSPITEYKTVQQCLKYSEDATREVGQDYAITTFDLGVCMKAYPLIWKNPVRYEKHIVMIGSFHVICAYLKMIGKKMNGTGLADIMIEAGLISSGSLRGVLAGKQYSRAMVSHKTMLEALERLLITAYLADQGKANLLDFLRKESQLLMQDVLETPDQETLAYAIGDEDIHALVNGYATFKDEVRGGKLGKTAELWLSYMDHIWMVLKLIQAVKTNNYALYTESLYRMSSLFFSFDGHNYSRYLTFFSVFLANVETSHPGATQLLEGGAFSVARSMIPGNRCPVDKTIEETIMKHAKSHGGAGGCGAGLTGLVTNYDSYQKWVRTTHERAQFVEATFSMADMLSESKGSRKHKDLRPAEVKKSEQKVQRTIDAVNSFINPFDVPDKEKLYSLSSGASASPEITDDVMRADRAGIEAKEMFIRERLEKGDHFFEPVKRMNLLTLGNTRKAVRITTSRNKVVEYKNQGSMALQLLVKSQESNIGGLEDVMKYSLTPVPYSIGTADGYLAVTPKAKGFHHITKELNDAPVPPPDVTVVIVDGNAMFYCMRDIPSNFKEISYKVFDIMPKSSDIIFSTDMYKENSIKALERQRRGCSEKLIIRGEMTKKPLDWKVFLTNDENKQQLIHVILNVWGSDDFSSQLQTRKVVAVSEGHAFLLEADGNTTKKTEIPALLSTQEETDTRVIMYCKYAEEQGYEYARVRTPDSDIFFIVLHFVFTFKITILFDTGTGNNKRIINITEFASGLTQEYCTALLALHAFTHCDTTSAFRGKGKVKPIKMMQKFPKFQPILAELGREWEVTEELFDGLEEFTCAIYGRPRFKSIDKLRFTLIKEKCCDDLKLHRGRNVDLAMLPPCRGVLQQHIRRVNYQVAIWRRADIPIQDVPSPTEGHGWTLESGFLEPLWVDGPILPQTLVDEVEVLDASRESDDEDSDDQDSLLAPSESDDSDSESEL